MTIVMLVMVAMTSHILMMVMLVMVAMTIHILMVVMLVMVACNGNNNRIENTKAPAEHPQLYGHRAC